MEPCKAFIVFLLLWPRSKITFPNVTCRYQFTVIRDTELFPKILEENLSKPSLSVIFTGDIDPETGKSWYVVVLTILSLGVPTACMFSIFTN